MGRIHAVTFAAGLLLLPSGAVSQCPGDANGNGFVNFADYGSVAQSFGQACAPDTRFVDNGNGTITDRWTRLIWEKKVGLDSAADLANLQDADNEYSWSGQCADGGAYCQPDDTSEAACLAGVEGDSYGCARCESGACYVMAPGGTVWQWLAAMNAANHAGHAD